MRANIQAVSLKIQTLKSQNAMAEAMKGVTKAMMTMNKQVTNEKSFFLSGLSDHLSIDFSVEVTSNSKNYARIRKTIRNDGYERRNDERRH